MKLTTKTLLRTIPKLYSSDMMGRDKRVHFKIFDPCGSGTWYIIEGEPEENDFRFFCLVTGLCEDELGYVMLSELESVRGKLGIGLERDLWFKSGTRLDAVAPEYCDRMWPIEDTETETETAGDTKTRETRNPFYVSPW